MNKFELAKWLHDEYEEIAKQKNWNTQDNCKVEFDALPEANKNTMFKIADRLLNFNLLWLHFVNDWYSVKLKLPLLGKKVLCYWNEYGEHVYIICKLTKGIDEGLLFEGWDVTVSHPEVTHWKYLSRPDAGL